MSSRPDISFEMFLKIRTDFDKFELKFWIVWKCGLKKERKKEWKMQFSRRTTFIFWIKIIFLIFSRKLYTRRQQFTTTVCAKSIGKE